MGPLDEDEMAKGQSQWIAAVVLWAAAVAALGPAARIARAQGLAEPAPSGALPAASPAQPTPQTAPAEADPSLRPLKLNVPSLVDNRPVRTNASGDGFSGWWRMLAALAVVLGLVFVLRRFLRRYGAVRTAGTGTRVIEVLSRTSVSPRHQVLLVRVGGRMLVVGAAAESLNVLAEISDPVEMGELLGAVERSKAGSLSNSFSQALRGWRGEIDKAEQDASADGAVKVDGPGLGAPAGMPRPIGEAVQRVKGMLDRVRRRSESPGGRP